MNDVAAEGVARLVARLNRDFRNAREAEVETMLEAAKAQEIAGEGVPGAEEASMAAEPEIAPEDEAEEILLQVKPK